MNQAILYISGDNDFDSLIEHFEASNYCEDRVEESNLDEIEAWGRQALAANGFGDY
jgi:hypothetical protein